MGKKKHGLKMKSENSHIKRSQIQMSTHGIILLDVLSRIGKSIEMESGLTAVEAEGWGNRIHYWWVQGFLLGD